MVNRALSNWFKIATPLQARTLAEVSGTSVPHLKHVSAGRRALSAELAQKLAHASLTFGENLQLDQRALCKACAKCPLTLDLTQ